MPKYPAAHGVFPELPVFAMAVLSAGLGQLFCGIAMQSGLKSVGFARNALMEMGTSKVFRKVGSPGMAYAAGGAPFVHSLLFCVAYWALDCKPPVSPVLAAMVLWACGAFHGLVIDFCSIRYSFDVTLYFAFTTLINAVVMGAVVEYIYTTAHWA
mmetsp:Transcript_25744/g.63337  ORF Transcript_25744/g.63337 Transcript_25744/m.63337 type:complete len:155 (+) Transcript_25744:134-598(+)|eukprot:CAMPEP_0197611468 /NCGR_PEP_ID=MMETSP1326-20131121/55448_1 /TAXON_ID=1155430 /ORGANISM="Genus nov. species nov., Strain RCC2288" /LENGTH=154 /DNA_ID=CAMNT_0043180119 /DNA_START=87 /DNA_END=551 /DNA_ORIENTATION=+